jgi:hypothetical protein
MAERLWRCGDMCPASSGLFDFSFKIYHQPLKVYGEAYATAYDSWITLPARAGNAGDCGQGIY